MKINHSGRITLILFVLGIALCMIFPPSRWFDGSSLADKHNLKPGIDIVGGTKLLYDIKPPSGGATANLAENVMAALKKRIDPDGVRNLIWRPQGSQLEIQMPASKNAGEAAAARKAFSDAQRNIESVNVRMNDVITAVETTTGEVRSKRLESLAMGSATRAKLFAELTTLYDDIQKAKLDTDPAHKDQIVATLAEKQDAYDLAKSKVEATNLRANDLETIFSLTDPKERDAKVAAIEAASADFPKQKEFVAAYKKSFTDFLEFKDKIDDAGELKRQLKGSGVLEFYILVENLNDPRAMAMVKRLQERGPAVEAGDEMRWFKADRDEEFKGRSFPYNGRQWVLAWTTKDKTMVNGPGIDKWALENAFPQRDDGGGYVVGFMFDPVGAGYFSELTRNNKGRPLAIVLDNKIISAPTINSVINRYGSISRHDGYSESELMYLVNTLRAGSLPASLAEEPISEQTVGPQLGADNLRKGFLGAMFGLVIVAIFLISYYYLCGVVATVAVVMNIILILGVLAAFGATFTLPGIAGIVLTIAAAVDANVLIFERLREEQHRGLNIRLALHNAYDRAFSAIIDSNVTTLITSLILYWLGSEEVKGFGLTLLIGLLSSLFTALYVTRAIFDILIDKVGVRNVSSLPVTFPAWDRLLKPDIDWIKYMWGFIAFSVLFIGIGCYVFIDRLFVKKEMLDIEFAAGTQVEFELRESMPIDQVRKLIESTVEFKEKLPSASVVAVGDTAETRERNYEIVTPNDKTKEVRDTIVEIFGPKMKIDVPSKFDNKDEKAEAILGTTIFPITSPKMQIAGFTPRSIATHLQGAAIVMNNIDPPLRPSEIHARIDSKRLTPTPGAPAIPYREFAVESASGNDEPTRSAVVLFSDSAIPNDKDAAKWRDDLVNPMWNLIRDAISAPAQLKKVTSFSASVAAATQKSALMALCLSLIVILVFIWFRFGDMKYGWATVVAMVHDTLLVIGAIGLSHLIADTAVGNALMVEKFRINLTLVSAILTIMSYSMIDTIVVFDRIRENRGKFGYLSRKILNDSVNQTLSRTLLTAGTNVVTTIGMYVLGGPSVHGFTFVLLVGIIVGTYSSFAIAAPILLIGNKQDERKAKKAPTGPLPQTAG